MFMVRASVWLAAIEQCRPDIATACRAAVAGARADGVFVRLEGGLRRLPLGIHRLRGHGAIGSSAARPPAGRGPGRRVTRSGHPADRRVVGPGSLGCRLGGISRKTRPATCCEAPSSSKTGAATWCRRSRGWSRRSASKTSPSSRPPTRCSWPSGTGPPTSRGWSTASPRTTRASPSSTAESTGPWGWYESIDQGPASK